MFVCDGETTAGGRKSAKQTAWCMARDQKHRYPTNGFHGKIAEWKIWQGKAQLEIPLRDDEP